MFASIFASLFPNLTVFDLHIASQTLIISAQSSARSAYCPRCSQASCSVHSSYTRSPRDLPLSESAVRIVLHVRRFRCSNPACPARTFAERFGQYLEPYAQHTIRLRQALGQLGLALGGAAGSRAGQRLHMPSSHDTVLRLVHQVPDPPNVTPRVLGVDDFALRKGQTYGTILVDLERRQPIELLPERNATLLATWLEQHPGIEIIARDRGPEYIRGATLGAPDAIQVADRFHLLCNLREALERTLDRAHASLRTRFTNTLTLPQGALPSSQPVRVRRRVRTGTEAKMPTERRERRLALYEAVRLQHEQGKSKRQIAQEFKLSPWLVRRFIQANAFPERAPKPERSTILTPFEPLLHEHWQQGERTTTTLFRLLQSVGYTGSIYTLRHWVQQRRQEPAPHTKPIYRAKYTVAPHEAALQSAGHQRLPAARRLVWLLLNDRNKLGSDDQELLSILLQEPAISTSYGLAQRFVQLVRQRDLAALDEWLTGCATSGVQEMKNFALGLQQDDAAVRAALTLPWSTGQVEGQITRLKLVKRQMYGRANFDLLRQRVLHPV